MFWEALPKDFENDGDNAIDEEVGMDAKIGLTSSLSI